MTVGQTVCGVLDTTTKQHDFYSVRLMSGEQVVGLTLDGVREERIGLARREELAGYLFDGEDDVAGAEVLVEARPGAHVLSGAEDALRGWLEDELHGARAREAGGVVGDQGDARLPRVLVFAADADPAPWRRPLAMEAASIPGAAGTRRTDADGSGGPLARRAWRLLAWC